jgi:Arc/MetJ family transcription regulator
MVCVVAPPDDDVVVSTDDDVLVVLLVAREELGVTAALTVVAMREIKVTARRKRVTNLLPRALQRCVRMRVLSRGDTMFPSCSFELVRSKKSCSLNGETRFTASRQPF